jgi:sigma-B regulation protein RsbU (phosphoserine phosphatase)
MTPPDAQADIHTAASAIAEVYSGISPDLLPTLTKIGDEINASLNLDEVLAHAAARIKDLIDYEIFAVLLLDETKTRLFFRFAVGYPREVVENWRIPIGEGVTGVAAATGQAVRVPDVHQYPRYLNAIENVASELAVPLMVQGHAIGVLDIQSRQLNYFTPDQQSVLTLLASRIAGAVENARLFERVQRQAETLLILNEVGREATTLAGVESVLRRSAELVKRVIDYQIFSILLYDESEKVFRHRVTVKFGQRVQEKFAVPAHEGIVGAAAAAGRPVVVPDVRADPRYLEVNSETRSELAVPMLYKNRVIGVLDLESPQVNYFTPDHIQALSIMAAHLAVSIENARLYEQVSRDEARMERDLAAARRLQGALLPKVPGPECGLDIAAHYISARELCGDTYDFLRYGSTELSITQGDVSGKGSAAALYGAVVIGILRSIGPQKLRPAHMLATMNQLMAERRVEGRFMTLAYATWNVRKRRLRIANAGQEQPLVYRNGKCEKLDLVGFPLGLFPDASYDEMAITLNPGEMIVFYSDGISDTQNGAKEFFGWQRLLDLICANHELSAAALSDKLLAAVDEFSGGAAPFDDRTLLVLKAL